MLFDSKWIVNFFLSHGCMLSVFSHRLTGTLIGKLWHQLAWLAHHSGVIVPICDVIIHVIRPTTNQRPLSRNHLCPLAVSQSPRHPNPADFTISRGGKFCRRWIYLDVRVPKTTKEQNNAFDRVAARIKRYNFCFWVQLHCYSRQKLHR